jgi:hypothetical protein
MFCPTSPASQASGIKPTRRIRNRAVDTIPTSDHGSEQAPLAELTKVVIA